MRTWPLWISYKTCPVKGPRLVWSWYQTEDQTCLLNLLVCAPCLRHRCVCVREEKQIFFWFSHLPSFPSSFMFFLSTFLGMFYVPLCSQIIPNSTIFWQKISQMIFLNVLPCQVSISRERIYQCPLPLFTTVGYMTLTWEINPLREN